MWGRALFAEDARFEVTGAFSLIGILPGAAIGFEKFPGVLAKLAIVTEIIRPKKAPPLDISLRIYLPGDALDSPYWEETIVASEMSAVPLEEPDSGGALPGEPIRRAVHVGVHNGLAIRQPGHIRVRAMIGESILPLGSLPVMQGPAPQA